MFLKSVHNIQKKIVTKKVKGGALYIAIIISIIIGIILCMFIMIANYNQRNITLYTQSTQLYYNLSSAFEIAQSDYFTVEKNDKWIKNTINDDSIKIKKITWGAYLLINAQTKNRHKSMSQCGLYGTYMPSDTGLLVSDNSRPVGLSGNISFKANCYLTNAGVKAAYIEGQSYMSSAQNAGFIKSAQGSIPSINDDILKEIEMLQTNLNNYTDSSVAYMPTKLVQSFNSKTVLWENPPQRLSNIELKNNIKIVTQNIEIDNTCKLDNILIICNKIKFKEGFKGKIHVIACDSIIMEKKCEFTYPSSFVLLPKQDSTNALKCIIMNEDCKFFGGILAITKNADQGSPKVFIKLNAKSEVNGFVFSSNYLHLEGNANATIITDKLLLKTPSAVYENHILSCEIDPKKYSNILAVPLVLKKTAKLICCEKLN
ncbi:MAG: hypothetical protein ABIP51_08560 [Bacteroidia bacterium]